MEADDFGELDELNERQVDREIGENEEEFEKEGFEEGEFEDEAGEYGLIQPGEMGEYEYDGEFIPAATNGN